MGRFLQEGIRQAKHHMARGCKGRSAKRTGVYSFEQRQPPRLSRADQRRFKANAAAWHFFKGQSAWYQRTATWWVTSAKREETRQKRLAALVEHSAAGRRIPAFLSRKPSKRPPGAGCVRSPSAPQPRVANRTEVIVERKASPSFWGTKAQPVTMPGPIKSS